MHIGTPYHDPTSSRLPAMHIHTACSEPTRPIIDHGDLLGNLHSDIRPSPASLPLQWAKR